MPKNLLQDMVKVKTIKVDRPEKEVKREPKHKTTNSNIDDRLSLYYDTPNKGYQKESREEGGEKSRHGLWFIAFISIIFLFFALSFLFSSATITVHPKVKDIVLVFNQKFVATKDSSTEDNLPFDLVSISDEESSTVEGGEEKDVIESAKGIVVIYNTFSSLSQNLDIDTRLEGSNGKIYKTDKKISVPGMKDGKPGSVEVGIHASVAGALYNSAPLDFKIFGFKGTPKYSKFYARSKGAITGGFLGKTRAIAELEKTKVMNDLKEALQAKLLKRVTDQIPSGFVLFKDAVFLNIDSENINSTSNEQKIPVSIKGTLYGFIFDENKLTKKIAEAYITSYDGSKIYIQNIKDLIFSISFKDAISFKDVKNVTFNLSGTPRVVWDVDIEKITMDVLGKKKKNLSDILAQYPNIDSADLAIRPIWKMSFPEKSEDIKVLVKLPE